MTEVPDWIIDKVKQARDLFGVGGPEWSISLKMNDRPGGHEAYGYTVTNPTYLNATIEFAADLKDDETGQEAVLHEVLHIALSEIWHIIVEKDEIDEYTEAMERFITRVVRSIISQNKEFTP